MPEKLPEGEKSEGLHIKIIRDFHQRKKKTRELLLIRPEIRRTIVAICEVCGEIFPENEKEKMNEHVDLHLEKDIEGGLLWIYGALPPTMKNCPKNQRWVFKKIGFPRMALETLAEYPSLQHRFLKRWKDTI